MKKKTILLSTLLLLLSSLCLYSAEAVEAPGNTTTTTDASSVSDSEWGWPERYKMKYRYKTMFSGYFRYYINGKKYTLEDEELIYITSLTDRNTKNNFKKLKYLYKDKTFTAYSYTDIHKASQAFEKSFNSFITSDNPKTAKHKEYFKNIYQKKIIERNSEYNKKDFFIGITGLVGFDMGVGVRFGFFSPVGANVKLGFLFDLIYRENIYIDSGHFSTYPKFIGGTLLFAVKVNSFYMAGGGFLHFRVSDEWIYSQGTEGNGDLYIRPIDYGLAFSIGYFNTTKKIKWFIGIHLRSSFSASKDTYYRSQGQQALKSINPCLEIGIGF